MRFKLGIAVVVAALVAAPNSAPALLPPGISPHALVIDPPAMTVANGEIYWINGESGTIAAARVDGSNARIIIPAALSGGPGGLTVSGNSLIWSSFAGSPRVSIRAANLDGSNPRMIVSDPTGSPLDVTVAGEQLYWLDRGNGPVSNPWPPLSVVQANLDGTGVRVVLADDPMFPYAPFEPRDLLFNAGAFTVAGNQLYWSSVGIAGPPTSPSGTSNGFIAAANLDGSNPRVISPGTLRGVNTGFGDFASDASHLYWRETGSVMRSGLDGSNQTTLFRPASFTGGPEQAIAVDTAHVYWGSGRTSIWEANLDGSDPHVLISDTPSAASSRCVVPNLKGKTLGMAKKLLARARCKLGTVDKSKQRAKRTPLVISQRPGAKRTMAAGSRVNVGLG